MKIFLLILVIFQPIFVICQNFESIDTDTLYSINHFVLDDYQTKRARILKDKASVLSKKIKSISRIDTVKVQDGSYGYSTSISNYDTNGFKINEFWNGKKPSSRTYKYDSWNNCIEESVFDENNNLIEKKLREFDKFGHHIYNYSLKKGIEKTDLTNELLTNGYRIIKETTQREYYTYLIDTNGLLKEYSMVYKNNPIIRGARRTLQEAGVRIDTTFEDDNGDYQKTIKFDYNRNKLIRIETYEKYYRTYTNVSYKYDALGTYSIDSSSEIDSGGLSRLQIFKYDDSLLVEAIDSTIKPRPVINNTYYLYNNFGILIQKKLYFKDNWEAFKLIKVFDVEYDSNKKIMHKSYYNWNKLQWKRDYLYDKRGNLLYSYYGMEKPFSEIFYKYDTAGILVEQRIITDTCFECYEDYVDDSILKSYPRVQIIKYNEAGKPVESLFYFSRNILTGRILYSYNNSNLVSEKHYENGSETARFEFRYNQNNNLIFEYWESFKNHFNYHYEYKYDFY